MKKTLIALAAVAVSTGAMAQAHNQVTISGTLDVRAAGSTSKVTEQASGATTATTNKTKPASANNGWSSSDLRIAGTEDLGGGLKASFQLNTGLSGGTGTVANNDRFLNLSGGFGSVRIGSFTPATNAVNTFYGVGTTNTAGHLGDLIHGGAAGHGRQNALQYTTPNMNGFTAAVVYGSGVTANNDNLTGKSGSDLEGLNFGYAQGALRVGAGTSKRTTNVQAVAAVNATTGSFCLNPLSLATSTAVNAACANGLTRVGGSEFQAAKGETKKTDSMNYLGASYNLGVATVSAVHTNRKIKTSTASAAAVTGTNISVNGLGVAVPMGAITVRASTYSGKDKAGTAATDDLKLSGNQLSVTYALSKRTFVYAVTGVNETKRASGSTAATTKTQATNVGLSHSF